MKYFTIILGCLFLRMHAVMSAPIVTPSDNDLWWRPFLRSSSSRQRQTIQPLQLLLTTLRGGSISSDDDSIRSATNIRVAYQGVPGAYSEKATRELLGPNVVAIGRPSFEDAFRAVASMEVDYACLPIENSLGGSIHENYDLMLRYQLYVFF